MNQNANISSIESLRYSSGQNNGLRIWFPNFWSSNDAKKLEIKIDKNIISKSKWLI